MASEVDDLLMGGGFGPAVVFGKVGEEHTVVCTGEGQIYDVVDFTTKQKKLYPSGDQIRAVKYPVAMDTEDKQHSLFVEKIELKRAIQTAIKGAGGSGFRFGDTLRIKRGPDGNPNNKNTHTFAAQYAPATDATRKRAQEIAGAEPDASESKPVDPWATTTNDGPPPF